MIEFLKCLGFGAMYVGAILSLVAVFLAAFVHFPLISMSVVGILFLAGVGAYLREPY